MASTMESRPGKRLSDTELAALDAEVAARRAQQEKTKRVKPPMGERRLTEKELKAYDAAVARQRAVISGEPSPSSVKEGRLTDEELAELDKHVAATRAAVMSAKKIGLIKHAPGPLSEARVRSSQAERVAEAEKRAAHARAKQAAEDDARLARLKGRSSGGRPFVSFGDPTEPAPAEREKIVVDIQEPAGVPDKKKPPEDKRQIIITDRGILHRRTPAEPEEQPKGWLRRLFSKKNKSADGDE